MTPEKRAEKLARHFEGMTFSGDLGTAWLITQIAAEIRAAVEDAKTEMYWQPRKVVRAEAFEEAAKIAFSLSSPNETIDPITEARHNTADAIGNMIRARAKDLASKSVGDEKGADQHAE